MFTPTATQATSSTYSQTAASRTRRGGSTATVGRSQFQPFMACPCTALPQPVAGGVTLEDAARSAGPRAMPLNDRHRGVACQRAPQFELGLEVVDLLLQRAVLLIDRVASSLAATFGSFLPVSNVRCNSKAFSSTLESAA